MKKSLITISLLTLGSLTGFAQTTITHVYSPNAHGQIEFDIKPVGNLIGSCIEGQGQGTVTGAKGRFEYNCTALVVSKNELKRAKLLQRNETRAFLNLGYSVRSDKQIPEFDTRGEAHAFVKTVGIQSQYNELIGIGVKLKFYCSEELYGHYNCSAQTIKALGHRAGRYYGSKIDSGTTTENSVPNRSRVPVGEARPSTARARGTGGLGEE